MKSTELRIGNWVNLEGHGALRWQAEHFADYVKSEKDGYDLSHLGVGEVVSDKIDPIPLNTEILHKLNLVIDAEPPYSKVSFGLYSYKAESPFHCYWDGSKLTFLGMPINHVHQLQNLYFALTVEELNIEL